MDVREYSEEVRRVVEVVGDGFHVSVDAGDLGCAMEAGLVTEPGVPWATLTDKGRELLHQMERDEKATAQASKPDRALKGERARVQIGDRVWEGDVMGSAPFDYDTTYRWVRFTDLGLVNVTMTQAEPKPAPEPPSWDGAPDWARWRAQDSSGPWWAYQGKPEPAGSLFLSTSGKAEVLSEDAAPNPNWRDTLQERPAPAPLCPVCGKSAGDHCWGLWCCGHCGGTGAWLRHTEDSFGHDHAWVRCPHCPAQTMPLGTVAEAVAAWNRRA